jgi:hypothetical protein
MSNKDLLKQAIAEAKTIREAAIANAKEALEESLTPHLKDMLAAKLQEMEEADDMDEIVNEEDTINNPEGETAHGNVAEAEEEEEAEEAEAEEAEEEGEEEGEEAEEEELDLENMSVEEFKDLVRDIVAQEVGHDESEEEMPGEEAPEGEDLTGMDSDEEEIDINEILAELAQEEEMKEGNIEEGLEDWIDKISAKLQKAGRNSPIVQSIEKAVSKYETEKHSGANRLSEEESEELAEALATIKTLRGQLQEVNLLNAKLLYVNKVFKSNNLSENQKVNVIAAFDKAETVKEVKLVFETVSKNVVAKPVQIREHKSFASKPAGTAATTGKKEVISEVSETVKRMQKLAGII